MASTISALSSISGSSHDMPRQRSLSSSSSISSASSSRSPSPPHLNTRPTVSSPLSSPFEMSHTSYFPSPSSNARSTSSSPTSPTMPTLQQPMARRSSQPSLFPRSQPLRPMVGLTAINGLGITPGSRRKSAAELEEEKYKTPINGTGRAPTMAGTKSKSGGAKLLVSKRMKTTFELNLNCRELSRSDA